MLIDSTYFDFSIANLNEPEPNSKKGTELSILIAQAERDVLSYAFGLKMWNDFKTYIADGFDGEIPQEYTDIINGKTYEIDGVERYWLGLIQPETKESLLADYVKVIYTTNNVTQLTEFGQAEIDTKVGKKASSNPKITKYWNAFVSKLQGGFRAFPTGYTDEGSPFWVIQNRLGNGYGIDYYGLQEGNGEVSLMQFIWENKELYPLFDQSYRRFGEFKNQFGI